MIFGQKLFVICDTLLEYDDLTRCRVKPNCRSVFALADMQVTGLKRLESLS